MWYLSSPYFVTTFSQKQILSRLINKLNEITWKREQDCHARTLESRIKEVLPYFILKLKVPSRFSIPFQEKKKKEKERYENGDVSNILKISVESKQRQTDTQCSIPRRKFLCAKCVFKKGWNPSIIITQFQGGRVTSYKLILIHPSLLVYAREKARERTEQSYPEITLADYARWKKIKRV